MRRFAKNHDGRKRIQRTLRLEALEARQMMSGTTTAGATQLSAINTPQTPALVAATDTGGATPHIHSPAEIRAKYGFNLLPLDAAGKKLDGSGQTIGIVVAFDDPNLKASLDLFDQTFGLPAASFVKAPHAGVPLINYSNADMLSWAKEAAMDIEWAHAIAPGATIELFEAKSDSQDDLLAAVNQARNAGNVSVVSMSWGSDESPLDDESSFQPTTSGTPMTFVASSGDKALLDGGIFPAVSGQVLAVGGTDLLNNNFEGGWGDGGGGFSSTEPEPAYQMPFQSTGKRSIPDVAYAANPINGFQVIETHISSSPFGMGGTSAGAPQWAALIAIVNQGRADIKYHPYGMPSLPVQSYPALASAVADIYAVPAKDFNDITQYTAESRGPYQIGPGYDDATGRGTPKANLLIPDLIQMELPANLPPYRLPGGGTTTSTVSTAGAAAAVVVTGSTATVSPHSVTGSSVKSASQLKAVSQSVAPTTFGEAVRKVATSPIDGLDAELDQLFESAFDFRTWRQA